MRALAAVALVAAVVIGSTANPAAGLGSVWAAAVRAPDFHAPLLGGGTASPALFKGKPAIVLFWAPW